MSSTYCIDCEKEAGDNWSECYFCGGKNLRKLENISYYPQESNSVTSIPEESEEDLLSGTENTNNLNDIVLRERVSKLLVKDKLTKSEKDELSEALRPFNKLSAAEKVALQMEYKNFRPQYTTKQKLISFFLTIILIAVVSTIVYLMIKF